jgi:hypothetical protein
MEDVEQKTNTTIDVERKDTSVALEITGNIPDVERARMLVLVYLDELVSFLLVSMLLSIGFRTELIV